MKAWTKGGENIDTIVDSVRAHAGAALKPKSDGEILGHAAWYMQHLALLKRKKELSQQWRAKKNKERTEKVQVELSSQLEKENSANNAGNVEQREEMVRAAEEQKKEAIRLWREQKMKEKLAKEEEEEAKREEERLRWEKKQDEHRYLRARVNDYRHQKQRDRERDKKIQGMMKKSSQAAQLTPEEIENRREKEIKLAKAKRKERERRERQERLREAKLKGVASGISSAKYDKARDFSRLVADTKASSVRAYTAEELDDIDEVKKTRAAHDRPVHLSSRDLQTGGRRAMPCWRKGVA